MDVCKIYECLWLFVFWYICTFVGTTTALGRVQIHAPDHAEFAQHAGDRFPLRADSRIVDQSAASGRVHVCDDTFS